YLGYLHFDPSHATYRRYYELAEQYQLPVIFHTGDTYSPYAKLKYSHPLLVDEVAVDHPGTKFVLAHLGNPWTIDAAEVIYKNMNVWADLSGLVVGTGEDLTNPTDQDAIADIRDRLRRAIRYTERANRFLYGSDWPLIPMAPYRQFIESCVPAEFHDAIFRENSQRLFRIA
ncbi:MAG: amidohydrolase family protein, partial [Gemmataceae bacterium]